MKLSLSPKVWSLAWPIILSNSSIPLLGLVDTAMVGHLPTPNDIAAVALGTMVFDVIFWCFGFLRMSTTAISAQESDSNDIFFQSCLIGFGLGLILLLIHPIIKSLAFQIIDIEPAVEMLFGSYFDVRIYSAIPTLLNYVIYGFFFGRQNTKIPLLLLLFTNITAMMLDYIFVWHLKLGAQGIAWANLVTQTMSALLGLIAIYQIYLKKSFQLPRPLFTLTRTKKLFSLNTDIFIRTLLLVLTTAFFTRQSAYLGTTIVAANMILMNFQMIASYALDGFAIAAETLVGQAVGQNDQQALLKKVKACALWSILFSSLLTLFYFLFGGMLIDLQTSIPDIKATAHQYLFWIIVLPILSAPGFLFDGVFIGAAWSKQLRNAIIVSSILIFFPVWYFTQPLGNTGLWLAYVGFIVCRGLYLGYSFTKKLD